MRLEQFSDQRVPVAARGQCFPSREYRLAVQRNQRAQSFEQQCRVLQEVGVLGLEQRDALRQRRAN
jgi:hypothetical protein